MNSATFSLMLLTDVVLVTIQNQQLFNALPLSSTGAGSLTSSLQSFTASKSGGSASDLLSVSAIVRFDFTPHVEFDCL